MGLDIYLEKCADFDAMRAAQSAAESEIEALFEGVEYDKLSKPEREALREKQKAIELKHGLTGEYGRFHLAERIERDSAKHPEHLFKVGYFRSSYNGSGFNAVMERKGLPTLYDILKPEANDEYYVRCDWRRVKALVDRALLAYAAMQQDLRSRVDAMKVQANLFDPDHGPRSEKEALDIAVRELQEASTRGHGYSCKDGEFHPQGIKVLALLPGKDVMFGEGHSRPCTYVVYETERMGDNDWYLQALQVLQETVDTVLADPHPEHFYLVWSS